MLKINIHTEIKSTRKEEPIKRAIATLYRDIKKSCLETKEIGSDIILIEDNIEKECFEICCNKDNLELRASDTLGFIYGIYRISEETLGVTPFWFWNDQVFEKKNGYPIPDEYHVISHPFSVKLRGWFINDEVLLHTWSVNRRKEEPWEMAFEALLRHGGNMVIPGTDKNSILYRELALSMGLAVTHHHSEPLGSEMFARAYPNLNPSYDEHGDKFRKLWQDAIEAQKGQNIVWNLGFRGQGDVPFWENDPRYETDEARGELMSQLIRLQYDMVRKEAPNAVCTTNLYGETMELYKKGYLNLPEDIIKIWADNGFGKMVTRRQENHNPRIYALPKKEDDSRHGIYYHVSFYDLQAANHMTMLPNSPEFVVRELEEVKNHGASDFWLINCSNIKPHVYFLDLIAKIWSNKIINLQKQTQNYISKYYGKEQLQSIETCFKNYYRYAVQYGPHEDDHAGEQFSNHVARMLICQCMKDSQNPSEHLKWATDAQTFEAQVKWYEQICQKASQGYRSYVKECEKTEIQTSGHTKQLFCDSILLQAKIHYHCFYGAYLSCQAIQYTIQKEYQKAFFYAGKAQKQYQKANYSMRAREHGKWKNFYANECLTDMKQTAWVLKGFMSYIRCLGDGPHYYQWQRDFLYSEEDRRVMLVMNMENHLKDEELFELMEEKWDS